MLTFWSLPLFSLLELCNKPREPLMTSDNKPKSEVWGGGQLRELMYSFGRVSPTCTMASSTPLTLSLLPLNSDIMFDIVLEIYFIPTKNS